MNVLSFAEKLFSIINYVLDLWRDYRTRQQVRAEIERDALRQQIAARRIAEAINRAVVNLPDRELYKRMRKYQRD